MYSGSTFLLRRFATIIPSHKFFLPSLVWVTSWTALSSFSISCFRKISHQSLVGYHNQDFAQSEFRENIPFSACYQIVQPPGVRTKQIVKNIHFSVCYQIVLWVHQNKLFTENLTEFRSGDESAKAVKAVHKRSSGWLFFGICLCLSGSL